MSAIARRGIYFGEGPRWHDGRLWYSDFYGHCVHAIASGTHQPHPGRPDGTVTKAADGLLFPNGMALTADGGTLIVAETFGAWLTAFAVAADGTLTDRRIWADLSGAGIYPDGICLDTDDAAWVATATQPRCVRVLDGGEIVEEAGFSQNFYACALGGPDRRTLYAMTAPTSVQAVALLHRGD